ncbi:MAG: cupin domain-containing protein [Microcoleaceae cyanobacterium]
MSTNQPISTTTAENFQWGTGCQGWHLLANDDLTVTQEIMPPNSTGVEHYHEVCQQFFYVLEGELTIVIEDKKHVLNSGDGMLISPGALHQIRNDSSNETHLIAISSPNSFYDFKNKAGEAPEDWKPDFFPSQKS